MKKTGEIPAADYLSHAYEIPGKWPDIPMEDEPFVRLWQKISKASYQDCGKCCVQCRHI